MVDKWPVQSRRFETQPPQQADTSKSRRSNGPYQRPYSLCLLMGSDLVSPKLRHRRPAKHTLCNAAPFGTTTKGCYVHGV
jgi:hypothetical protein